MTERQSVSGAVLRGESRRRAVVLVGGGTGGHLAPAVAVAQVLQADGHPVVVVASKKAVDAMLLRRYPELRVVTCPGVGWGGKWGQLPGFLASQVGAAWAARRILHREQAGVLVGFGGFLTGGFVLASRWLGVPVVLHEANQVPGKAVRQFARWADQVWLPPSVGPGRWVPPGRVGPLGLPLRAELQPVPQREARLALGLPVEGRLVLVAGGSQGAAALNDWAAAVAPELAAAGVHCLCLGGGASAPVERFSPAGVLFRQVPFCDEMACAVSAADVVVARAGAGTIAELARCRRPAVLVPYPYAADQHQAANADYAARVGGCRVCDQGRLEELGAIILGWLSDKEALSAAAERMALLDPGDAAEVVAVDAVERLQQRGD